MPSARDPKDSEKRKLTDDGEEKNSRLQGGRVVPPVAPARLRGHGRGDTACTRAAGRRLRGCPHTAVTTKLL